MIKSDAPLIAVVMMIKNESQTILETLTSLFQGGLRHFFIYDTGSTDQTVTIVEDFFTQNRIIGHLKQEPFIDFATSRNKALELAEDVFSDATFFLMPDAEWDLHHTSSLINFCERQRHYETPLYLISTHMNGTEFTTARLFRKSCQIRFSGVVHEVPSVIAIEKCPEPIHFRVNATQQGIEKSRQRWQRDLLLLSDAFHTDKHDPRTSFYLAQTYECLGLLENAYQTYQHRETLPGWDEENFITCFRLGCLAEELAKTTQNFTWDIAMNHYLKAFALRSHRIEPLVKIADHFWTINNIPSCYLFINYTYNVPYPHNDTLFIEKNMYDFDRYEIMSRCAWYMGEYALGERATLMALERCPELPHLQRNLTLYREKLESASCVS